MVKEAAVRLKGHAATRCLCFFPTECAFLGGRVQLGLRQCQMSSIVKYKAVLCTVPAKNGDSRRLPLNRLPSFPAIKCNTKINIYKIRKKKKMCWSLKSLCVALFLFHYVHIAVVGNGSEPLDNGLAAFSQ